jgi:hypothetical protein
MSIIIRYCVDAFALNANDVCNTRVLHIENCHHMTLKWILFMRTGLSVFNVSLGYGMGLDSLDGGSASIVFTS